MELPKGLVCRAGAIDSYSFGVWPHFYLAFPGNRA